MIRKGMKLTVAALGVTAMVAGASVAQAAVTFDPDGAGALSSQQIDGLDWSAGGNTFAEGGNQAVANYAAGVGDTTFYTYYQSTLAAATLSSNPVTVPFLQGYEISIVAKFQEQVTSVDVLGNSATFDVVNNPSNYVEIYASPINANAAAGTGFNDGVLILKGTVTGGGSTFATDPAKAPQALAANSSIPTVIGDGGGVTINFLDVAIDSFNADYFQGLSAISLDFSGNLSIPFTAGASASSAFLIDDGGSTAQGVGTTTAGAGLGAGNFSALGLGNVNGQFGPDGGPSIQFQTDGFSSVTGTPAVPEPATAAMGLITLAGLAVASRRRRRA